MSRIERYIVQPIQFLSVIFGVLYLMALGDKPVTAGMVGTALLVLLNGGSLMVSGASRR